MATTIENVIIVDVIKSVIDAMNVKLSPIVVNYVYGRQISILEELRRFDGSINSKGLKYPLFALYQDFPEKRGIGYYAEVTFPRIQIACLTDSQSKVPERYSNTFKPILYPVYTEFLKQLVQSRYIVEKDVDTIRHTKWDRAGTQPIGSGVNDFVDAIDILNLTITINQKKTC